MFWFINKIFIFLIQQFREQHYSCYHLTIYLYEIYIYILMYQGRFEMQRVSKSVKNTYCVRYHLVCRPHFYELQNVRISVRQE